MAATPSRRARVRQVVAGRQGQLRAERAAEGTPLTYKELAASLGVSESTLYKTRKGTRSGTKVYQRILQAGRDREAYQVIVQTRDKRGNVATQSVNVAVTDADLKRAGIRRRPFSGPRVATNPETQKLLRRTLTQRAAKARREKKGTGDWTRNMIVNAEVVSVRRPREVHVTPHELKLSIAFPQVLPKP